ncbi:MAG: GTP cyclohydrolase II [Geminicoccaceae bacterium]
MSQSCPLDPAASMVAVDRAAGELRRNGAVIIDDDRGAALAQAAETLTGDDPGALARLAQGQLALALTAHRASVLKLVGAGPGIVILPVHGGMDAAAIRCLIDPTCPAPQRAPGVPPLRPEIGDCRARAAVLLCKLAQLLPAALLAPLSEPGPEAAARLAGAHDLLRVPARAIMDYPSHVAATLQPVSEARVPLRGAEDARLVGFRPADGSAEQFAIVIGEPAAHQPALCRVHSECFTGDLLGSLRCDCGPQLQEALRLLGTEGHGVLLYLAHEGRGIGLINKLRAYQLQDWGLDTVDANQHLGFEPDERTYRAAAVMLRHLGIDQVRLLTNNPAKVEALAGEGIRVVERIPHATAPNRHNVGYLTTKASRSGHLF